MGGGTREGVEGEGLGGGGGLGGGSGKRCGAAMGCNMCVVQKAEEQHRGAMQVRGGGGSITVVMATGGGVSLPVVIATGLRGWMGTMEGGADGGGGG